jgi:hypothetical protein
MGKGLIRVDLLTTISSGEGFVGRIIMNQMFQGIIHGNLIELQDFPQLADGQKVQVIVKTINDAESWGEGLKRCAGILADENPEQDDKILEEIYQERKTKSHREIPE